MSEAELKTDTPMQKVDTNGETVVKPTSDLNEQKLKQTVPSEIIKKDADAVPKEQSMITSNDTKTETVKHSPMEVDKTEIKKDDAPKETPPAPQQIKETIQPPAKDTSKENTQSSLPTSATDSNKKHVSEPPKVESSKTEIKESPKKESPQKEESPKKEKESPQKKESPKKETDDLDRKSTRLTPVTIRSRMPSSA